MATIFVMYGANIVLEFLELPAFGPSIASSSIKILDGYQYFGLISVNRKSHRI